MQVRGEWNRQSVRPWCNQLAQIERALHIFSAPEKDDTLWFYVDYRKCNAVALWEFYAIPCTGECIERLRDETIFSTLNANCSYWKSKLPKRDRVKTFIGSHYWLFQWILCGLDLKTHRHISACRGLQFVYSQLEVWVSVPAWDFDFLKKPRGKYQTNETRLEASWWCWCHYRIEEMWIFLKYISYSGHAIIPRQLAVLQLLIGANRALKTATNITLQPMFLDLCNLFRSFVPNYAHSAASLNRKLQNDQPTHFENPFQDDLVAPKTLQQKLISPPVVSFPLLKDT